MNENIKQAIQEWQGENKEKRAILLIAIEEKGRTEDKTECEIAVAAMGSSEHLVKAVKSVRKDGGEVAQIFNKADMSMLLEKTL